MAQVKVYCVKDQLLPRREVLSKKLIRLLFDQIQEHIGIDHQDLEICIAEHPPENWGFRGFHGDEVSLSYKIDV